jgi:uncharacterized membrane protein HdeD (DUF308 family)
MRHVESCCFCVDLETGGKFWGWLGVVLGVFSLVKGIGNVVYEFEAGIEMKLIPEVYLTFNCFQGGIAGALAVFYLILDVIFTWISWLLVKGIEEVRK